MFPGGPGQAHIEATFQGFVSRWVERYGWRRRVYGQPGDVDLNSYAVRGGFGLGGRLCGADAECTGRRRCGSSKRTRGRWLLSRTWGSSRCFGGLRTL